ncbi:GNAT family N-acetyltransferase [Agrobacterium sp. AGB01]|uniref:GNAT family N-acetyltransferase n=1 Tax=Agrobacterium sp. AGB01 TaxID=2769302 RepID=UPI0017860BBD|nr:GNAT family N-acetyltransferase [Agrobacterium sp. AGB01]MBD9390152.1 GNAT family N-acetyltransferase [Agrobacterium sp. AGB01]
MHFGIIYDSPWVKSYADLAMGAAKLEGAIPVDRKALDGTEHWAMIRYATDDGYINAGIAIFYSPEPGLIWIDFLYVAPDFRRRGIATRLIEGIRQQAKADGYLRYGLGTLPGNYPMLSLIGRCGGLKVDAGRSSREGVYFFESFGPPRKKAVKFQTRADRDRVRQKRGESRKQQLVEVRRQIKRFKDGADPASCMQAIVDVTLNAGGQN